MKVKVNSITRNMEHPIRSGGRTQMTSKYVLCIQQVLDDRRRYLHFFLDHNGLFGIFRATESFYISPIICVKVCQ